MSTIRSKEIICSKSEMILCSSLKLNKIRLLEKDAIITHWDRHVSRQRWDSVAFPAQTALRTATASHQSNSLSLLITHRRQCQGHKFCPHHYLLITMFVRARSVRGNRWCVWQCVQHQACSALVRVDRVDMCPDHKAQTCAQVTNVCLSAFVQPSVQWVVMYVSIFIICTAKVNITYTPVHDMYFIT